VHHQNSRLELEVGQGERGQLGKAQCAGEAQQGQSGVASALTRVAVDPGDDLSQLAHTERACRAARRGPHDLPQPTTDPAHGAEIDEIGPIVPPVLVSDRATGKVNRGERDTVIGALSQTGAHRRGLAGNGTSPLDTTGSSAARRWRNGLGWSRSARPRAPYRSGEASASVSRPHELGRRKRVAIGVGVGVGGRCP
jgi:hypothetical protein